MYVLSGRYGRSIHTSDIHTHIRRMSHLRSRRRHMGQHLSLPITNATVLEALHGRPYIDVDVERTAAPNSANSSAAPNSANSEPKRQPSKPPARKRTDGSAKARKAQRLAEAAKALMNDPLTQLHSGRSAVSSSSPSSPSSPSSSPALTAEASPSHSESERFAAEE